MGKFSHFHRDPIAYELAFLADIPRRIGIEGDGIAHFLTDSLPYLKAEGENTKQSIVRTC